MTTLRTWMSLFDSAQPPAAPATGNLLLELDFYDKSPLTQVLLANRGRNRFIHFTKGAPNRGKNWYDNPKLTKMPNRDDYKLGGYDHASELKRFQRDTNRALRRNATAEVPKLGVNVTKFHRDPHGVYFYPVDWLLTGTERMRGGMQYGLDMPYYYVVDINMADPNGIDLATVTWPQIEALAVRNGWRDAYDAFRAQDAGTQAKQIASYGDVNKPGSFLWHFVESLVRDEKISWNKAFAGVSFIRDPGLAIIHNMEPDQLLVLNPAVIKVISQGENVAVGRVGNDEQRRAGYTHARMGIIKALRGEFGGDLTWDKKKPTLSFKLGVASFTVLMEEHAGSSGGGEGLVVRYQFGRAEGSFYLKARAMDDMTPADIVTHIAERVRRIGSYKTDLLFKPVMSEAQAQVLLTNLMGTGTPRTFKTTIYNDTGNRKDNAMLIHGDERHEVGRARLPVASTVFIHLSPDEFSLSASCKVNDQGVFSASPYEHFTPADQDAAFDHLAEKLCESFDLNVRRFGPSNSYVRNSWEKLPDEATFEAFKGWLAKHCGLSLDGRMERHYQAEIAAYEAFADKDELEYKIRNLLSRY